MSKTRIQISRGRSSVNWNDRIGPDDPAQITCASTIIVTDDEAELRNLHECLDFLYGKNGGPDR